MSLFMSFITDICSVEDHFIIYNRTIYNFIRMYAGATCRQGSKVRSWIELKCLILHFSCAKRKKTYASGYSKRDQGKRCYKINRFSNFLIDE